MTLFLRPESASGIRVAPSPVLTVTADTTLGAADAIVLADATSGAVTVTLPDAAGALEVEVVVVKRTSSGANAVTVATTGSQTIDGASTQTLSNQYDALVVASDGADWHIVGKVT